MNIRITTLRRLMINCGELCSSHCSYLWSFYMNYARSYIYGKNSNRTRADSILARGYPRGKQESVQAKPAAISKSSYVTSAGSTLLLTRLIHTAFPPCTQVFRLTLIHGVQKGIKTVNASNVFFFRRYNIFSILLFSSSGS